MYHLKCLYRVSDRPFDAFIKLFKRAPPQDSTLLNSFKKMQAIIKQFDLGSEKIDICANDSVLFWKDKLKHSKCPECNASRYKTADDRKAMQLASCQQIPVKVLHYLLLIPRLKRLYMSSKIGLLMRWHADGHIKVDKLRHPTNAGAWKAFDDKLSLIHI